METLTFTPYRGKFQPVIKVHKAQINLLEHYLEIVEAYDFEKVGECVTIKTAYLINKAGLSLFRNETAHDDDIGEEWVPTIEIGVPGLFDRILLRVSTDQECNVIYLKLKKWLIGDPPVPLENSDKSGSSPE